MTDSTERDPVFNPRPGDIVRSEYDSIGERHVVRVSDNGVRYWAVHPKRANRDGICFLSNWTKWCRSHRVEVMQRGE